MKGHGVETQASLPLGNAHACALKELLKINYEQVGVWNIQRMDEEGREVSMWQLGDAEII